MIGREITALTGDDVVTGVLAYRGVALCGLALTAWALPRLARRMGADPDHALWLGAANRGGRPSDVIRTTCLMTGVAVAAYTWLALATGVGVRWLTVLEAPGSVVSFLSVTTDLGIATAVLGVAVGLGAHLDADLALLHGAGTVTAVVLLAHTLHGCLRRHRDPLASLAVGMAAVALLAVQTQPWYLLWALIPAAATPRPKLHQALGWGCVVLAVLTPPTGGDFVFRGFHLTNALVGAALLDAAVLGLAHLTTGTRVDPG